MVSIGGWGEGVSRYSKMMSSSNSRKIFINSVVDFIKENDFDGLDIDIEYPGYVERGGSANDKVNFYRLIQELKTAFKPYNWELTIAVPINSKVIENGYRVRDICL